MVSAVITSLNPGIAEPNETDTRFPRRKYPLVIKMSRGRVLGLELNKAWGGERGRRKEMWFFFYKKV